MWNHCDVLLWSSFPIIRRDWRCSLSFQYNGHVNIILCDDFIKNCRLQVADCLRETSASLVSRSVFSRLINQSLVFFQQSFESDVIKKLKVNIMWVFKSLKRKIYCLVIWLSFREKFWDIDKGHSCECWAWKEERNL